MHARILTSTALTVCLLLGASACGGSSKKSEADIKKELSTTLQGSGGGGLDKATADCFAQIVIEEVGVDALRKVDLSAAEPPAEISDQITKAATRASTECTSTSSTTTTAG